ncbi:hypothetical protein ALC53_12653, partial [Atta colombica]
WVDERRVARGAGYYNNYLVSDHISLRESLFCFSIVDSSLYVRCGVFETPNHVFWECSAFTEQRRICKMLWSGREAFSLTLSNISWL